MGRLKSIQRPTGSNVKNDQDVRVRHAIDTNCLAEVNAILTTDQRNRIEKTPFKWVVGINKKIKLSGVLLRELVSRWLRDRCGFRVRSKVVPFTPLDVCYSLGLRIVGEPVPVDEVDEDEDGEMEVCQVKRLFRGQDITISNIIKMLSYLNNEDSVDDFCRVYILLAFSVLFFPLTTPIVSGVALNLLDDLDCLDKYNWGGAVYDFLEVRLSRATKKLIEGSNSSQIHLAGCAALLQLWAIEHLSLHPLEIRSCFPRIVGSVDIDGGKTKIQKAFSDNVIIDEIVATIEDQQQDILTEGIAVAEKGYVQCQNYSVDFKEMMIEHRMLMKKNEEYSNRIAILENEVKLLKDAISGKPSPKSDVVCNNDKKKKDKGDIIVHNVGSKDRETMKCYQKLYNVCTRRSSHGANEPLVNIAHQILTLHDLQSMKARGWVDNMVILFAANIMMTDAMDTHGVKTRYLFSPQFTDAIIQDLKKYGTARPRKLAKRLISQLGPNKNCPIDDIRQCELVFAPTIYDNHWFCYVLDPIAREMSVLDSMQKNYTDERQLLDYTVQLFFEELFLVMDKPKSSIKVKYMDLPQQNNNHDCGVYVLLYMEMWNGVANWGGKTMPSYTSAQIDMLRQHFVCQWVLHPKNIHRKKILEQAALPVDLEYNGSLFT